MLARTKNSSKCVLTSEGRHAGSCEPRVLAYPGLWVISMAASLAEKGPPTWLMDRGSPSAVYGTGCSGAKVAERILGELLSGDS